MKRAAVAHTEHAGPATCPRVTPAEAADAAIAWRTPGGIPVSLHVMPFPPSPQAAHVHDLRLHLEHARLGLLRGFDELLCLDGLRRVEQLPYQIETVRKVLRHFRGRVLLADEVGLGKTIEACLLLREYLLRGMVGRVLVLVPSPLVSQWHEELESKFQLDFTVARHGKADVAEFWAEQSRVLASLSFAKSKKRSSFVSQFPWDLVIVDEAHHCKNRSTVNWKFVNSLQRRFLFLLTATPVQNNLVELYNLLTLLVPGHLRTESEFKRRYVARGNPRDPRNRHRLRSLLNEVMVRNTRSLVHLDLPPRYAQTLLAQPRDEEAELYRRLTTYLRVQGRDPMPRADRALEVAEEVTRSDTGRPVPSADPQAADTSGTAGEARPAKATAPHPSPRLPLGRASRLQLSALLGAQGSHPQAIAASLRNLAREDAAAAELEQFAASIPRSAKDERLLEVLRKSHGHKVLVFVNFRRTLDHLAGLLTSAHIPFSVFSGQQTASAKDRAVDMFREQVPVMLCTESGGEGRNLQFADTLVNYDLPWNPMKIEQRIGRIHRYGQTRDVFIFNLCTAGSLESRILRVLDEKIRMFELVVGEVGSILGNLEDGEQFESLVLDLWLQSSSDEVLEESFSQLGDSLLRAHEAYVRTKELDEALFGEDFQ